MCRQDRVSCEIQDVPCTTLSLMSLLHSFSYCLQGSTKQNSFTCLVVPQKFMVRADTAVGTPDYISPEVSLSGCLLSHVVAIRGAYCTGCNH